MRLGQNLGVRKFQDGGRPTGLSDEDYDDTDIVSSGDDKQTCLSNNGNWNFQTGICSYGADTTTPTTTTTATTGMTSTTGTGSHATTATQEQCPTNQGAVWTGYTCDYSGMAGHEQVGGIDSPQQFEHLSGLTQDPEAMQEYLTSAYGLQDPERYLSSWEAYNPAKEQKLQKSYEFGLGEAKRGSKAQREDILRQTSGQISDLYTKSRAAGSRGTGFGGAGRKLSSMLGKTFAGQEAKSGDIKANLASQQERLGKTLEGGITGLRESYVDDWLGVIPTLGGRGAQFCTGGKEWDETLNDGEGGCV